MKVVSSDHVLTTQNPVMFNTALYNKINSTEPIRCYALENEDHLICAAISFCLMDDQAFSLPRSPHAGMDLEPSVSMEQVEQLLHFAVKDLHERGMKKVIIKQGPVFGLSGTDFSLSKVLYGLGFVADPTEINHHYDLLNFEEPSLHLMQKRKIKKCVNAGLKFLEVSVNELRKCHSFIGTCREQQGLMINISFNDLKRTFDAFPDDYRIFGVFNKSEELVACTVTIRVNKSTVYNFLPAFDRSNRTYSPLTLLYLELFKTFKKEGMSFLDLGISSIEGNPQDGLVAFKERMGALRTERSVFVYS